MRDHDCSSSVSQQSKPISTVSPIKARLRMGLEEVWATTRWDSPATEARATKVPSS